MQIADLLCGGVSLFLNPKQITTHTSDDSHGRKCNPSASSKMQCSLRPFVGSATSFTVKINVHTVSGLAVKFDKERDISQKETFYSWLFMRSCFGKQFLKKDSILPLTI
jgi:hypothetical protein